MQLKIGKWKPQQPAPIDKWLESGNNSRMQPVRNTLLIGKITLLIGKNRFPVECSKVPLNAHPANASKNQ